jgi:rare lipoprotein A
MTDRINKPALLPRTGWPARGLAITLLIGAWSTLGGCSQAIRWDDSADQPPQRNSGNTKKRSSQGNPPFYEVFGQRYYVMDSGYGFSERGVASWYGKKFHGRPTSSGAIYDMHAMTAAHKTLPLPTRARVRNLKNGRSIIVMINDRGPFVDNRIIDLSYAAATRLDMIREGTALVEIEVLTDGAPTVKNKAAAADLETQDMPAAEPVAVSLYLQVGAFGDRTNAQQLLDRLHGSGFSNAIIRSDTGGAPSMFRVRLGPIADVTEYDLLIEKMAALEIVDTHLVSESRNAPGS